MLFFRVVKPRTSRASPPVVTTAIWSVSARRSTVARARARASSKRLLRPGRAAMEPLFEHYDWVLTRRRDVIQNFKNSVMVTTGTVILSTITAILAGYALVHLRTPFRRIIVAGLVASMFFPTRVTALIGIYNIQDALGFINQTWSLMLPYTALSVAISVFVMRGVFETVPKEIVDSSRVDGASSLRTLVGKITDPSGNVKGFFARPFAELSALRSEAVPVLVHTGVAASPVADPRYSSTFPASVNPATSKLGLPTKTSP